MLQARMVVAPVALAVGLISCVVAVAPVPGAEKLRLTRNASEVSGVVPPQGDRHRRTQ
jgi:hypothetical protein